MPTIAVKSHNPFGLTLKQKLFIAHLVTDIHNGKPIRPKDSVKKVYTVKNDSTARVIASQNLTKLNIQQALQYELKKIGIIGDDSKTQLRLIEGLDAVNNTGEVDYMTRLQYLQEIHKVIGLYDANH